MLIIFGALKIEILAVLKLMTLLNIIKTDGVIIYEGKFEDKTLIAVVTGMGRENSTRAVELVMEKYITPRKFYKNNKLNKEDTIKFIITGLCGATDKNLKTGSLVVYDLIKNIERRSKLNYIYKNNVPGDIIKLKNDSILNLQDKFKLTRVTCGTVPQVIMLPCQKEIIGKQFMVQVIDLESYWIARRIIKYKLPHYNRNNLPLYCIRAVSDAVEDRLPEYFGNFSKAKIISKLLKSLLLSIAKPEELKINIKAIKNVKKALHCLNPALKSIISYLINK